MITPGLPSRHGSQVVCNGDGENEYEGGDEYESPCSSRLCYIVWVDFAVRFGVLCGKVGKKAEAVENRYVVELMRKKAEVVENRHFVEIVSK